jgi:hypothetical protein
MLSKMRLFLLVRDPRDCQASWWHARHLHTKDAVASPIIESARLSDRLNNEDFFDEDVGGLLDWCDRSGGRIYRYEDMVQDPLDFINAFLEFSGLPIKSSAIDSALLKAAFLQGAENVNAHNRSGAPFAALRTLPDEDLEALNRRFNNLVDRLGYPLDSTALPPLNFSLLVERDAAKRFMQILAFQNGQRITEIQRLQSEIINLREQVEALLQSHQGD